MQETAVPLRVLISGVTDQRLARPEQQDQQNAEHTHHREHRLVEDDLDHAVPEPGSGALDHGAERLLTGLMDIVPELAKSRKAQVLVGDPAGSVIDHENKTAGQQQQSDHTEKPADHASPCYLFARRPEARLTGADREIQPRQRVSGPPRRRNAIRKALTLRKRASIRRPMAAGAILPPLF